MDQKDQNELDRPNQNANKEPAEGSRETVGTGDERGQRGSAQHGAGITNRPLGREQKEQDEVPPRGQTKDEERNERR
jgi:hypothetical protein